MGNIPITVPSGDQPAGSAGPVISALWRDLGPCTSTPTMHRTRVAQVRRRDASNPHGARDGPSHPGGERQTSPPYTEFGADLGPQDRNGETVTTVAHYASDGHPDPPPKVTVSSG